MSRQFASWWGLTIEATNLWAEAWVVILRRTMKLAMGGDAARTEAQTMVVEKAVAAMELSLALASGRLGNNAEVVTRRTLSDLRGRVNANRQRLR